MQPGSAEGIVMRYDHGYRPGNEDTELRSKEFVSEKSTIISAMLSQGSSQPEDLPKRFTLFFQME